MSLGMDSRWDLWRAILSAQSIIKDAASLVAGVSSERKRASQVL